MAPKDTWGPRKCPKCGAEPYVYCKTTAGHRASLPHRERFPEDPPRVYGIRKQRRAELRAQEAAKAEELRAQERKRMPLSLALRDIDRSRMTAFRDRAA